MTDEEETLADDAGKSSAGSQGTLYVMRETDPISGVQFDYFKIGLVRGDREVRQREKDHKTGNPRLIDSILIVESPEVQRLETYMHNKFAQQRVSSGEWFHLPGEMLNQAIDEIHSRNSELLKSAGIAENFVLAKNSMHDQEMKVPSPEITDAFTRYSELAGQNALVEGELKVIKNALNALLETLSESVRDRIFKPADRKATSAWNSTLFQRESSQNKALYESFMVEGQPKWSVKFEQAVSLTGEAASVEIPTDPFDIHQRYLELWSKQAEFGWQLEILERELIVACGSANGIDGIMSWKSKTSRTFDKARFAQEHPDLLADRKYFKETEARQSYAPAEWASRI